MERKITNKVTGYTTHDGAGVKLVRVLGRRTSKDYDPFLMLDSFDSKNPLDYSPGFPLHPHRGIETITYLSTGEIAHQDSIGNKGVIRDGEVQWMTAGSGIMHEEMPRPVRHMLGVQVWLNLPQKDKMTAPAYNALGKDEIIDIPVEGGKLRLISGSFREHEGFQGKYVPANFYSIQLDANASLTLDVPNSYSVILFTLRGDALIAGEPVEEKTAVATSEGKTLTVAAADESIELLFLSAPRLNEDIAWGGPIVMNTEEELQKAFSELRQGNFIK
jgi:redox-sensitive bicupin YhaK (pirin superfamily)